MNQIIPGTEEWHNQVVEEIIDPERVIVDPHHHLWKRPTGDTYVLEDLWKDTGSGHKIIKTVFIECRANYREDGPEHLQVLGETEFVNNIAEESAKGNSDQARISGIVAKADLTRGDTLEEVLDAHTGVAGNLFKGIRHAGASDEDPVALSIPGRSEKGLYLRKDFQEGMKVLGRKGLTYDTWHYHHQNRDFLALAQAVPDTVMILDHFGTPLGVGRYAGKREEIFLQWKKDIAEIAKCENVIAKLGGLAMPDNGFGWDRRHMPPTSDEFVYAQKRYYLHTLECFGPERCMFESNFPVDKRSLSYAVLWNGLKKMVANYSEDEKTALFSGTATRIYRL
ncbi:MAG: amidohydrolase family protein [Desulfobacteraceae bacterium]|nr:amidohydrolase family protein [Desulfobacteraceae bacterium]MBU4001274.1 amidohydrolase family protein [Pseudomonadota bacterium]